jgi:hypothetical protein
MWGVCRSFTYVADDNSSKFHLITRTNFVRATGAYTLIVEISPVSGILICDCGLWYLVVVSMALPGKMNCQSQHTSSSRFRLSVACRRDMTGHLIHMLSLAGRISAVIFVEARPMGTEGLSSVRTIVRASRSFAGSGPCRQVRNTSSPASAVDQRKLGDTVQAEWTDHEVPWWPLLQTAAVSSLSCSAGQG